MIVRDMSGYTQRFIRPLGKSDSPTVTDTASVLEIVVGLVEQTINCDWSTEFNTACGFFDRSHPSNQLTMDSGTLSHLLIGS